MKIAIKRYNAVLDETPASVVFAEGTRDEVLDQLSNAARGFAAVDVDVLDPMGRG
jgi:hypothetical protein